MRLKVKRKQAAAWINKGTETMETIKITRSLISKANEAANGVATPYKLDVLNEPGMQALMGLVWDKLDGSQIKCFFASLRGFLTTKQWEEWNEDVYNYAEAKRAAYKAQKSSTGYSELSEWYIISEKYIEDMKRAHEELMNEAI